MKNDSLRMLPLPDDPPGIKFLYYFRIFMVVAAVICFILVAYGCAGGGGGGGDDDKGTAPEILSVELQKCDAGECIPTTSFREFETMRIVIIANDPDKDMKKLFVDSVCYDDGQIYDVGSWVYGLGPAETETVGIKIGFHPVRKVGWSRYPAGKNSVTFYIVDKEGNESDDHNVHFEVTW